MEYTLFVNPVAAVIAREWSEDFKALGVNDIARFWLVISRAFDGGNVIVGSGLDRAIKDAEANMIYGTSDMQDEARIMVKALRAMKGFEQ